MIRMTEKVELAYRKGNWKIPQMEIPFFNGVHICTDHSQNGKEYQDKARIDVFYILTHKTIISQRLHLILY